MVSKYKRLQPKISVLNIIFVLEHKDSLLKFINTPEVLIALAFIV